MQIIYRSDLDRVNWPALKSALAADDFDNGRTPEQLERSFRNSHSVCIARDSDQIIGTARILSDGVCNAYLVDVWTLTSFRRHGIARRMIEILLEPLRGQHIYLQSDDDTVEFYKKLGFREQPAGMSKVIGQWLVNDQ